MCSEERKADGRMGETGGCEGWSILRDMGGKKEKSRTVKSTWKMMFAAGK